MSAFTDLLERHVPYASHNRDGVVCLVCLDDINRSDLTVGCGEFATTADWALHVEAELRAAGLKVTKRAVADEQPDGALF